VSTLTDTAKQAVPNAEALRRYVERVLGPGVELVSVGALGEQGADAKAYGYGRPLRIDCRREGRLERFVLETMDPTPFGHEHVEDRTRVLLWEHRAFNRLPRHARALDVGAFAADGQPFSLSRLAEPFILMEYVDGRGYFEDLTRLRETDALAELDLARTDALCDYLVDIHGVRGGNPGLYTRRVRELVGDGECIMGLADSYPARHRFVTAARLEELEMRCVAWRWRLKERTHRLRQVHGDFHPWNILFAEGTQFTVLDRARGEWGEPADDVTSLSMNYLFFSLQRSGRLEGAFETLFQRFWERYLEKTGDRELLEVAAPFFVFRGLVMASPLWYPDLPSGVRESLFAFMKNVLAEEAFDPGRANAYLEA
jgi:aminoglycoside phosphotransferase (APT) family kinase protein